MTDRDTREALRALEREATPGPWISEYSGATGPVVIDGESRSALDHVAQCKHYRARPDANLIAAARNALPGLLDDLDAAEAERDLLRVRVGELEAVVARVDDAANRRALTTQEAQGKSRDHWRGPDFADGYDSGTDETVDAIYAALRSPTHPKKATRGEQYEWWQHGDTGSDRRLVFCVARWPECAEGEYNPSCCRFPKSCSATVYDSDCVSDADLEPRRERTQPEEAGE